VPDVSYLHRRIGQLNKILLSSLGDPICSNHLEGRSAWNRIALSVECWATETVYRRAGYLLSSQASKGNLVLTSLRNKSVIVTGGSKGIGKGIVTVFARLGAQVSLIGRNENDGAAVVEALRGSAGAVKFCRGDVKEQADMERADGRRIV
jgi:hypothetical protein